MDWGKTILKSESRRVKMTKKLLNDALVESILEEVKPAEKVTVTEICKRADVNRSTYYTYYSDPIFQYEQLLQQVVGEIQKAIASIKLEEMKDEEKQRKAVMHVLRVVKKNFDAIRVFDIYSGVLFWQGLSNSIQNALAKSIGKSAISEREEGIYTYCMTGSYALVFRWINMAKPETMEELADLIITCNMNTAQKELLG